MNWLSTFSVVFLCIVVFSYASANSQVDSTQERHALEKPNSPKVDIEMQRLVLKKINAVDFESLKEHMAIHYLLDIAKSLDKIDKQELVQNLAGCNGAIRTDRIRNFVQIFICLIRYSKALSHSPVVLTAFARSSPNLAFSDSSSCSVKSPASSCRRLS